MDFRLENTIKRTGCRGIPIIVFSLLSPIFVLAQGNGTTDNASTINLLQIISLVGSLATIILGVVAIWLSLYFYRRSNEINNAIGNKLSTIEVSSKMTETTSVNILQPVLETVMSLIKNSTISGFDNLKTRYMGNIDIEIEKLSLAKTDDDKQKAMKSLRHAIDSFYGTLTNQIDKIDITPSPHSFPKQTEGVIYGFSRSEWVNFIQKINKLESENDFLSVKWLRNKLFENDPDFQKMLQIAIDKRILLKDYLTNKKNPQFPTLACKLDRDNPLVIDTLSGESGRLKND